MPRSREFDYNDVLEKAMHLFWQKGYHNTSLNELVDAMGINRFSLYATFESKENLFRTSVDYYMKTVISVTLGPVERAGVGLDGLHEFFSQLITFSQMPVGRMGCLVCNSAVEFSPEDPVAADKVNTYFMRLSRAFESVLSQAVKNGEVAADFDVKSYADYLNGVVLGLVVSIKSGKPKKSLDNYVKTALSGL